jgi:hypothetical protein
MSQSSGRNTAYGVVILLAVVGSVYAISVAFRAPIKEMPDDKELAQQFICAKCGAVSSLTPRQLATAQGEAAAVAEARRVEMTSARKIALICPQCKEIEMTVAQTCPKCQGPFLKRRADGSLHHMCAACEKAEGKPKPAPPPA